MHRILDVDSWIPAPIRFRMALAMRCYGLRVLLCLMIVRLLWILPLYPGACKIF